MPEPRAFRQHRFAAPPGATEVLLVRHGESQPAVEGQPFDLVDGHGDPALSPEGREQAVKVCARLAGEAVDAIYVSKLRRTTETASALAAALALPMVVDPDLHEVFLGDWEGGEFRRRVAEGDPIAVRMLTEERWDVIPNAEPAAAFADRVRRAITRIAAAHPDQRVAAFAHGGAIGEVLAQATGARPFAFSGSDNASISHLVVAGDRWILRRFNDTTHLDAGLTVAAAPPA
ncbi:MAG: histidine phosphatase family protein [Acidimicrobiales bacterium]